MGVGTIALDDAFPTVFGNKLVHTGTFTPAASYLAGGDTISLDGINAVTWEAALGMSKVDRVFIESGLINLKADLVNDKVLAYESGTASAPLDEADDVDDNSAVAYGFFAIGKR